MDDRLRPHLEALLAEAGAAAAAGEWDSARSLADAALALDPGHAGARRHLELAEEAMGAGERRQLTVMFCDVVGSTALSQRTDPEILGEVLRAYRVVLDRVVSRAGGRIALWIGDGALVYFGHPTPHEDDAWRGTHAGLDLLAELDPVVADAWADHRIDLAVRVAVHTGIVVRAQMGTPTAPDRDAIVGPTPNLAARLQDKARPGTLLISEATHDLVRGRFAVVPVGPFRLKGFDEPVNAYAVEFEVAEASAVELVSQRGSFVGRSAELAALQGRWLDVEGGAGGATWISGDAGIGKSRLAAELRQHVLDRGGQVLECACAVLQATTPLHPVIRLVERGAGIERRRPTEARTRLRAAMEAVGLGSAADAVAAQLGLVTTDPGERAPAAAAAKQREVALRALVDWLAAIADRRPLLLVVEDAHWIDPTSLELLRLLVDRRPPRLLLVVTARSGTRPLWSEAVVPVLALAPLTRPDARRLAADIASGHLGGALIDRLVERCDGVPLFVEELITSALTGPTDFPATSHAVPSSLRDPLLARLAAAGSDFVLPQVVATVGDHATVDVLRAVGGWSEPELEAKLDGSVRAGILVREPQGVVRFRHQLLAELAYDTQLHRVRQDRHAATALVLAAEPGIGRADDATLAHHLERAGQVASAVEHLLRAARATQRKGAHAEAMAQLDHAIAQLDDIADEATRVNLELLVREARHFSRASMLASGTPEAAADFARCVELLHDLPPRPEHDAIYVSVFGHLLMTGQIREADKLNRSGRTRFARHGIDEVAMPVDAGACLTTFFAGDIRGCIEHGTRFLGSEAGRLDSPVPDGYPLPNELVSTIGSTVAAALALAGEVDASRSRLDARARRAASLDYPHGPYSAAWIHSLAALAWFNLGDEPTFRRTIDALRAVTAEHAMDSYELISNLQDAMAGVRFGEIVDAEHMSTMLNVWKFTGADAWLPCFSEVAADAHRRAGDTDAALATIDDAIDVGRRTSARFWESPLLRLRGAIRDDVGDDLGLEDIQRAIVISGEQGTRLFEVVARAELARRVDDPTVVKELEHLVRSFPDEVGFGPLDAARRLLDDRGRI